MVKEFWLMRCQCPDCESVLWVDAAVKTICSCSASWLEADGTLSGNAKPVSDQEMIDFIIRDWGIEVELVFIGE